MMIIKYYEWLRFLPDERHAVYEICERDSELKDGVRHVKHIEKEEAKKLIEANNLHVVHRNKLGVIWE